MKRINSHGGDPLVGEACLNWLLTTRILAKKWGMGVEGPIRFILYTINFKQRRQAEIDKQGAPSGRVWATIEEVSMEQSQNGLPEF